MNSSPNSSVKPLQMPEPTALPQKCEIHGCKLEIFTGAWGLSAMHPTPYCPQCGAE